MFCYFYDKLTITLNNLLYAQIIVTTVIILNQMHTFKAYNAHYFLNICTFYFLLFVKKKKVKSEF